MKLHIQEPANGYTVSHVSHRDEQSRPVCRIDCKTQKQTIWTMKIC